MGLQSDVELAVTGFDASCFEQLSVLLPEGYTVESRVDAGYGLVVRGPLSDANLNLEEKFMKFLIPLLHASSAIKNHGCLLRVAIFSTTVTSTVTWTPAMLDVLGRFSAALETTTYPTD